MMSADTTTRPIETLLCKECGQPMGWVWSQGTFEPEGRWLAVCRNVPIAPTLPCLMAGEPFRPERYTDERFAQRREVRAAEWRRQGFLDRYEASRRVDDQPEPPFGSNGIDIELPINPDDLPQPEDRDWSSYYEREFDDDSRRGTTAALSGRHSSPVGLDDPEDRVYDLIFVGDLLEEEIPLPLDIPGDLFIDRLITVSDRDTLAFTDRLTGDGTAVVAHLYDTTSQKWAAAVIPLDFVGFLPGVTLEQENAWVASLRNMAMVGEVV